MSRSSGGEIYLSTSYAVAFSGIHIFPEAALTPMATLGEGVPLYALDSAARAALLKLPPMAEEIEVVDGRLYTMCESASSAYLFGRLTGGQWCYATDTAALR